jgi:selenocysteine lyase/cysteine desulfurase
MTAGTILDRAGFPVTRRYAYLDFASVGPPSRITARAVRSCMDDFAEHGSLALGQYFDTDTTRARAAELLGTTAESVGFVRSTTAGLAQVVRGLGLGPGDRVAVPYGEFPTMAAAVAGVSGVEIAWVNPSAARDTTLDDYRAALADGPPPKLVVAPWVDRAYDAVNLRSLAHICHEVGARLCVDLIRGAGVLPLALDRWEVDFATTNSYKWLLAGPGLGLLYVNRTHLDRLETLEPGWMSMWQPALDHAPEPHPDGRRFEGGTPAIPAQQGLAASLGQLLDAGVEALAAHAAKLRRDLTDLLADADLPAPRTTQRTGYAPAAACRIPVDSPGRVAEDLATHGVICGHTAGSLLVSFHGFTDHTDLDRLVKALHRIQAEHKESA